MPLDPAPRSVPELFLARVGLTPDAEAFRYPVEGGWKSLTWTETEARVRAISSGLRASDSRGAGLRHPRLHPHRVGPGRLRDPVRRRRHQHDLPVHPGGGLRLHPVRLGLGLRLRRERRAGDEARLAPSGHARPAPRRHLRRPAERRRLGHHAGAARGEGSRLGRGHHGAFEETALALRGDALATLIYTSARPGGRRA